MLNVLNASQPTLKTLKSGLVLCFLVFGLGACGSSAKSQSQPATVEKAAEVVKDAKTSAEAAAARAKKAAERGYEDLDNSLKK